MRWIAICLQSIGHIKPIEKHTLLSQSQNELSNLLSRFSPALFKHQEQNNPEKLGVLLEVASCFRLFGGANQLLMQLLENTQRWQESSVEIRFQVAAWSTAQGAWWLAKQAPAKSLDDLQNMHQETSRELNLLDPSCLDLSEQQIKLLEQCGLWNLEQINALPRDSLKRRFGTELLNELDKGYGRSVDLRLAYSPTVVFHADQEMPFHATALPLILQTMKALLLRLEKWLRSKQIATHHLLWTFRQPHQKSQLEVRSGRLLQSHQEWLLLTEHQLKQLQFDDDVQHIELQCKHLNAFEPNTYSLLFDDATDTTNQWQATCDRLRARLGPQTILFPQLHSDPRPECSFDFKNEPTKKEKPKTTEHDLSALHVRPLWLLKQPVCLKHNKQWNIVSGPERIEFGWWDERPCKRDYYRVINSNYQQAWIFKDLEAQSTQSVWYLHGYFS